jgi:hypothetical protein
MTGSHQISRISRSFFSILIVASLISSCSLVFPGSDLPTTTPEINIPTSTPAPVPMAEIIFIARIPADTPAGQGISLDILDEVTGLALHVTQNLMSPIGNGVYSVKIIKPLGTVLKYRYSRFSSPPSIEYTSTGKQVRYRLYSVVGPSQVEDEISAWTDLAYSGAIGRIQGNVTDSSNNSPIPGLLVEAGGVHAITSSTGFFLLEGLPPGKHNLFVYSLDGKYKSFQQEAVVGADATTPAHLSQRG